MSAARVRAQPGNRRERLTTWNHRAVVGMPQCCAGSTTDKELVESLPWGL